MPPTPTITVSVTTEVVCRRCGMSNKPDIVLEIQKLIDPLAAEIRSAISLLQEEFMTTAQDVHDLVIGFNDALNSLEARLVQLGEKAASEEANAVTPADVQGLRDELQRARTLASDAVATSTAAQEAGSQTPADVQAPDVSPTPPTPDTGNVSTGSVDTGDTGTTPPADVPATDDALPEPHSGESVTQ